MTWKRTASIKQQSKIGKSVIFLFTEPGLCTNNRFFFFSAHKQTGQPADREERFPEFDNKYIILELLPVLLR